MLFIYIKQTKLGYACNIYEKNKKRKEGGSTRKERKYSKGERERELREEEEGSGKWDCLGEISGAPVPPRNEFPIYIYSIFHHLIIFLSFFLSLLSLSLSSLSMQLAFLSPLLFSKKKSCLFLLHTKQK